MRPRPALPVVVAVLVLGTACPSAVNVDCQALPSAQGGYVLHLVRTGPAAPGCDASTPEELSDVWVFDTLAGSRLRAHSVRMPYPTDDVDPLPSGLVAKGAFSVREADAKDECTVPELSVMSGTDATGTAVSYATTNMRWLSGAAAQGAEFTADVSMTVAGCTATYAAQALSPSVGCDTNADCDPFKQPISSGIFSIFAQGCVTDPWTAGATSAVAARDTAAAGEAVTYAGVCFLKAPYPSLGAFTR